MLLVVKVHASFILLITVMHVFTNDILKIPGQIRYHHFCQFMLIFRVRPMEFGDPEIPHFWPTVLSVEPMVQYVVCLSVCRLSSVTFCIVAKRCVLAKKCLKE